MLFSMQYSIMANPEDNIDEDSKSSTVKFKYRKKDPPPETLESVRDRRLIILSFWVIIITIGIPIWWTTTAVYRASLPIGQMLDWANGKVCNPQDKKMKLPVQFRSCA